MGSWLFTMLCIIAVVWGIQAVAVFIFFFHKQSPWTQYPTAKHEDDNDG